MNVTSKMEANSSPDDNFVEDFLQTAVGTGNDVRSRQAKEALRSEGFKDIEDMKSRIKNVGDLVGMGVPLPQSKLVWKAMNTTKKDSREAESPTLTAQRSSNLAKQLPALQGVKMHISLHEWYASPSFPLSLARQPHFASKNHFAFRRLEHRGQLQAGQ